MTVLGIDTATAVATAGVFRDGAVLGEVAEVAPGAHARCLAPLTETVLARAGVSLSSLDGIAVSVGPGSFTGLRIGISFAKGIAYAAGRPLVAVRTLEALAISAPPAERVAVCLDARKGEVYLAIYHRQNGRLEVVVPETAVPPEDAVQEIERHFSGNPGILVGDAAELRPDAFEALNRSRIRIIPFAEVHPRGGTIAALGHLRLEEGAETAPEALLPLYVRASEAERRASQNLR